MPRQTMWVDTLVNESIATSAQGVITLLGTAVAPEFLQRGNTIVRTIFDLRLYSATVAGAWGVTAVDLAFGIASQESFAVSVVSDPNVAAERPIGGWMYRTRCMVSQNGTGTAILHACTGDLRNMRKLDTGQYFLVANVGALNGATFTVKITGIVRVLLKLP